MMNERQMVAPRSQNYNYRDTLAASQKVGWRIKKSSAGTRSSTSTNPFFPKPWPGWKGFRS